MVTFLELIIDLKPLCWNNSSILDEPISFKVWSMLFKSTKIKKEKNRIKFWVKKVYIFCHLLWVHWDRKFGLTKPWQHWYLTVLVLFSDIEVIFVIHSNEVSVSEHWVDWMWRLKGDDSFCLESWDCSLWPSMTEPLSTHTFGLKNDIMCKKII